MRVSRLASRCAVPACGWCAVASNARIWLRATWHEDYIEVPASNLAEEKRQLAEQYGILNREQILGQCNARARAI